MSLAYTQQMNMPRSNSSGGGTPYQTAARGNRYIPPTFDYGRNPMGGNTPNYRDMQWNTMQDYYLPNATNRPYSGQIQQGGRDSMDYMSGRYGSPNRQPVMPQFDGGDPYGMYDPRGSAPQDYRRIGRGGVEDMASFGGGQGRMPRFDPRMLMQLMYGGMSEDQMFGDSGMNDYYDYALRLRGRGRQDYQQQERPYSYGANGPKDPMAGIKPNQISGGGGLDAPANTDWWSYASSGFKG